MSNIVVDSEDRFVVASRSMMLRNSLLAALLLLLVGGTPAVVAGADCTKPPDLPPIEAGQPRNLAGLKRQLLYYECSGTYASDVKRQIDRAISYLAKRAKQGTKLALVLDIDETSLSNWEEMKANDFGLIENGDCNVVKSGPQGWPIPEPNKPCGFAAWVLLAAAKPLDTLRLFQVARENNVAVFFITGRQEGRDNHKVREATVENLHKAGYKDWTDLLLKSADDQGTLQEFKTAKRKEITDSGFTIIANVGDQYSDLKGGYAERVYKLPNPFYFVR